MERGHTFKRYIRAAAALQDIYDDAALASAIGVHCNAVRPWWEGTSKPGPNTLRHMADVTRVHLDELVSFVYYDGPPPSLVLDAIDVADKRVHERLADEAPITPVQPRRSPPHGSGQGQR